MARDLRLVHPSSITYPRNDQAERSIHHDHMRVGKAWHCSYPDAAVLTAPELVLLPTCLVRNSGAVARRYLPLRLRSK